MPLVNKLELPSPPKPIKIKENFWREYEISWSNDFYSDMFCTILYIL